MAYLLLLESILSNPLDINFSTVNLPSYQPYIYFFMFQHRVDPLFSFPVYMGEFFKSVYPIAIQEIV